jgi:hypothetical protein
MLAQAVAISLDPTLRGFSARTVATCRGLSWILNAALLLEASTGRFTTPEVATA